LAFGNGTRTGGCQTYCFDGMDNHKLVKWSNKAI
jgi:hypothetical protein